MDVSNATWAYIGGFNFRFDKCSHVHNDNAFVVENNALRNVGYDLGLKTLNTSINVLLCQIKNHPCYNEI
jgi:hypothetical protein